MIKIILVSALLFAGIFQMAKAEIVNVTLQVENMTCASCPFIVKKAVQSVEGVQSVTVDYEKKAADVMFDDEKTNIGVIIKATGDAGYPSSVKNK
ncbi:MAG: mercury resistance system periplasmic binding protein MerP [Emcibacter sp.]|nr:mercury resistance system periplasmic binding protein MerP [Emcibacter sp.]HEC01063.1 mercury resistance system periplasmic binding protein MerP [Sphingomonadales bacterium]